MKKVIIFSAPSGSGKTTLVRHCLEQFPQLAFSVSCTTRAPRGAELHGVDYHFLSPAVEFEEVYADTFYGTLKSEVERIWNEDKVVIFDVDVLGGIALKKYFGDQALSVFIMPPSVAELELRLIARGTDDLETIKMRVAKATEEISHKDAFDVIIVNDQLASAQEQITKLLTSFINS